MLASTALIVVASLVAGQALLALAGRRDWTLRAAPVGLALLLVVAGLVAGHGGRGAAIAIALGSVVALAAAVLIARRPEPPRIGGALGPLLAAAFVAVFAALPFIAAGRVGILGVGLVNDDMAYHLLMADWIAERFSPEPELVADGYPLGPHGLVAGLAAALGARSIDVFAGLVLAIPALSALLAFSALGGLRPAARVAVAGLVAVPYLAAAYLAQEAFKEPIVALLVLGFVLLAAERPPAAESRYRWGRGLALGAVAAGMIYVYSFPGLAWLAAALAVWAAAELWRRRDRGLAAVGRGLAAAAAPAAIAGLAASAVLTLPDAGRIADFADFRALDPDRANEGGLGNLRGHLSPLEALGVWPTSEFRLPAGAGALPAVAFYAGALLAAAGLAVGVVRWARLRGVAIPAALAGAAAVYAGARGFGTVYTSAKALAIAAPLIALVSLGGLLSPGGEARRAVPRALLATAIGLAMAASSFLVLRQAPVGPETHLDELGEIRPLVAGEDLLFLGRDNFVLYGLRGSRPFTHVRNFYDPFSVRPNEALDDVQAKFDFDSVDGPTLARFPYVLTTRAAYASGPPPGYEAIAETASYVLWSRGGEPAGREPVEDDADPGATLACRDFGPLRGRRAARLDPRPVAAAAWTPAAEVEDGSPATVELDLPPGAWELSIQYDATAPLRLRAAGLEAELPGNLDYRGAVPFWPAGRIDDHPGGRLRIEASVAPPPLAGRLLGARTVAHLGTIAATPAGSGYGRPAATATPPFPGSSAVLGAARRACGEYGDWVELGGSR